MNREEIKQSISKIHKKEIKQSILKLYRDFYNYKNNLNEKEKDRYIYKLFKDLCEIIIEEDIEDSDFDLCEKIIEHIIVFFKDKRKNMKEI
jgi:hypothetical protein